MDIQQLTSLETLAALEHAIEARLGPLREGVQPLLDEAREHLTALEPEQGERLPPPQERQERQVKLAAVLEQMEDILEALDLAVRTQNPSAERRESRG